MTEPTVCCVMLVNGREAMVKRAIASFRAQTYERKRLLIWNTGAVVEVGPLVQHDGDIYHCYPRREERGIGTLRNKANAMGEALWDLIAHFDSDDWSHPRRLEEQVALLQRRPDIDCVGYNRALFWDTTPGRVAGAWEFAHGNNSYVLGASMMYRTEAWRCRPFNESADVREDYDWWVHNSQQCLGMSSLRVPIGDALQMAPKCEPRIICSIHGENTSDAYALSKRKAPGWERAEEWDGFCIEAMKL